MTTFNNPNSLEHIEKFLDRLMSNMQQSGLDRQINSGGVIGTFIKEFLSRLDHTKNFYYLENNPGESVSFQKILERGDGEGADHVEIIYDTNQILRASFRFDSYDMGNENRMEHVLYKLGAELGYRLHGECFGDSYVISDPIMRVNYDPLGHNDIDFLLKFNINPKIRKNREQERLNMSIFGGASIQFPTNYNPIIPTYP